MLGCGTGWPQRLKAGPGHLICQTSLNSSANDVSFFYIKAGAAGLSAVNSGIRCAVLVKKSWPEIKSSLRLWPNFTAKFEAHQENRSDLNSLLKAVADGIRQLEETFLCFFVLDRTVSLSQM